MILSVAFVNGWTDAPNSVAACVSTGVLPIKTALRIAAISDFVGSVTVGMLSGKVYEKIIKLTVLQCDEKVFAVSIFSAMLTVVLWAVSAWYFGIPTSESHSILAGIFGSSVAVNGGFESLNINEWIETMIGLILSVILGFVSGYVLSCLMKRFIKKYDVNKFKNYQIIISVLTSFMHGAQDSQKFVGIIISVISITSTKKSACNYYFLIIIICSLIISFGVITGGDRIINTVGNNMVKLDSISGLSADASGFLCLLLSTLYGVPTSTTHIKTASILGAGSFNGKINKKTIIKLFLTWFLTFPVCGLLSYIITSAIIR